MRVIVKKMTMVKRKVKMRTLNKNLNFQRMLYIDCKQFM
jgi:hypothetical protein